MSRRAFTLLELIVVIVVLGILAAIAVPTFAAVFNRSYDKTTIVSLQSVAHEAQALEGFDRDGWDAAEDVEPAVYDLEAGASAPGLRADASWTPAAYAGTDPAAGEVMYEIRGPLLVLSMRSGSGAVCVVGSSYNDVGRGACGEGEENVFADLLATRALEIFPEGSTPADPPPPAYSTGTLAGGNSTNDLTLSGNRSVITPVGGGGSSIYPNQAEYMDGWLYVVERDGQRYTRVNASTGQREILASTPYDPITLTLMGGDLYGMPFSGGPNSGLWKLELDTNALTQVLSFNHGSVRSMSNDGTNIYYVDANRLYRLDPATGQVTTLPVPPKDAVFSVEYDGKGNLFYVVHKYSTNRSSLMRISVTGPLSTGTWSDPVQVAEFPEGAAWFSDVALAGSTIYAASSSSNAVYAVDTTTGTVSLLSVTPALSPDPGMLGVTTDGTSLYLSSFERRHYQKIS